MRFCNSSFWDTNSTNLSFDFTECFEESVLIYLPCVFLWIFSSLEFYYLKTSRYKNTPWGFLSCMKAFTHIILIFVSFIDLLNGIYDRQNDDFELVSIVSPVVKILTFIYAGILMYLNKKHGIQSSGLLFLFWFFLLVLGVPQLSTEIQHIMSNQENHQKSVIFLIHYFFVFLTLILNIFADTTPDRMNYTRIENPSPEASSSFVTKIFYLWFDRLTWKGFKRPLTEQDIYNLNVENTADEIVTNFNRHFNRQSQKSIVPVIFKTFGGPFYLAGFLRLITALLTFVSPQLLRSLIRHVKEGGLNSTGITLAFGLFACGILTALLNSQQYERTYKTGLRIRTALVSAIYRKSLKLSNTSKQNKSVGEIVNLMSIDTQKFSDTVSNLHIIWGGPIVIALAVYFLWQEIGPSTLAGVGLMVLLIPLNIVIAGRMRTLQFQQMKVKDQRIRLMNEIVNGIKVLKLYAWEPSFEKYVEKFREKELKLLTSMSYYNAAKYFIWTIAPFFVALVSFVTFVLVDENNVLDAETAFVSLALFNILKFPMSVFPVVITNLIQIVVSIKRINDFLNSEEIDKENVTRNRSDYAILIDNGSFNWSKFSSQTCLRSINLRVKNSSLIAVVGPVGSGKSSLISAILGEMEKLSGSVNCNGTIAYVPQQAWIQNATVQDNILFGKSLDTNLYNKVIESCALKSDIEILPGGDQTEIGEKGVNLSGGQKQRISLARAVYNDADIYLLDDPLSAVDSDVGKHIFENIIGPKGMLAGKTVLLVTHGISFLPQVDEIFIMNEGSIAAHGNYRNLIEKKEGISENYLKYLNEITENTMQVKDETNPEDCSDKIKSVQDLKSGSLIENETIGTGNVGSRVYYQYCQTVGLGLTAIIFLLSAITQFFTIYSNILLSKWTTDPNAQDPAVRKSFLIKYGGYGSVQAFTLFIGSVLIAVGCLKACKIYHNRLLSHSLHLPILFFDTTPTGRIINRFSKDVDVLDSALPIAIRTWIITFFNMLSIFIVISYSTPIFMSVLIPILLMYLSILMFHIASSRQLNRLESVTRSPIYSHFGETLAGQSTIRAYGDQERFIKESELRVDFNQKFSYANIISNRWIGVRLESVGSLVILFAALFAVLEKGNLNPALAGLSITFALQITTILNILVRTTADIESNIVSIERFREYTSLEQEDDWTKPGDNNYWLKEGKIRLENFQLKYREGLDLVLKNIDFEILPGEKVGIVGRTGSGKSSLTLALFRVIESSGGRILIDDTDISKIGLHTLRSNLTIIPQDPFLFFGTLRLNIDPFNSFTDDEVWTVLELSHLKKFVTNLQNGLLHIISENGENLSVGQRQLICLARALLRKTKILILDEATASVDLETDDLIQKTIRSQFKDCTVITIAHRLNTILDSDKIVVLDQGRVAEFGSPETLLDNVNSNFYAMIQKSGLVNVI